MEQRKAAAKEEQFKSFKTVTLENLFDQLKEGDVKELNIIVKADVQGSVEAVRQSLEKLSNDEVKVKVIHGGVGAINESDVMLANASNAIIVGFNGPSRPRCPGGRRGANGVDMRMYRVIYDCIEEIESAMKGMLAPKFREVIQGRIEVRAVYKISSAAPLPAAMFPTVRSQETAKSASSATVLSWPRIKSIRCAALRRCQGSGTGL